MTPIGLVASSDQTNTEGDSVSLQLQGLSNGGSLTYSASGLPDGLSLNPTTGLITGTIASGAAAEGPFTVDVAVSNGTVSASQTFNWNINPVVNLTAPDDQSNNEGDNVSLQVTATDALGNALTYTANNSLPPGLSIDSSTGLISGMISAGDAANGPYAVTVTATDGTYSSNVTFTWNVTHTDTTAPTMTNPGTQTNVTGDSVNLPINASDAGGDALTYSATGLPDGLDIDPGSGIISGTVADIAAGTVPYQVTVTASDPNGLSVSQTFSWLVNAPALNVQTSPVSAVEGNDTGAIPVATFTTPDLNSQDGDFTATINWGDGNSDMGTVSGSNGSFTVTGDHTYATVGSYPVTITITDMFTGASTTGTITTTVTAAALTATGGFDLGALANQSANLTLATFTSGNPNLTASDFTATIDWGDGSGSLPATVNDSGDGMFSVSGSHSYAQDGAYTATIIITGTDGTTANTTSTVTVGDVFAGIQSNLTVASFTDADTSVPASSFTATIDWGDGNQSSGTVTGGNGTFTVQGTHTYAVDSIDQPGGVDQVTVTVNDQSGDTLTSSSTVAVVRPPMVLDAGNVATAPDSLSLSNVQLAAFTVPDTADGTGEFSATIDWGDNSSSSGTIQEVTPGLFNVVGSHTYSSAGEYVVSVTVSQGWQAMELLVKQVVKSDIAINGGKLKISTENSGTGTIAISFTGPKKLAGNYLQVQQWMQIEVYGIYACPPGSDPTTSSPYVRPLPAGQNLDPEGKAESHGHTHVSALEIKPSLQVDNGDSKTEFSVGKYTPSDGGKTITYKDFPDVAGGFFPQAAAKVKSVLGLTAQKGGLTWKLETVRVIQRFVTIVYLGGKPVQTVVWTSTSEGTPDGKGPVPKVQIIKQYPGYKIPVNAITGAEDPKDGDF